MSGGERSREDSKAIRIVIADDHAIVREGLRRLLEAEDDCEVVAEAADVDTARRYVRGHHPDVLVLDLSMPSGSGLDAIAAIRAEAPGTQIVVLTMNDASTAARQALSAGALGYVLKDAALQELVDAVRCASGGRTYLQPALGAKLAREGLSNQPDNLSAREVDVLRLLAIGHTNAEIAGKLYLSVRTVEAHRARLMQKLGITSRAELVSYAREHGLGES
jgi:two-component system response regulator NreC